MKNKIFIILIPVFIIIAGLFAACGGGEETVVAATQCTITFDLDGGVYFGGGVDSNTLTLTVGRDSPMGGQYPTSVRKEGYVFSGWWEGSMKYGPNDPIYADLTLKAKWLGAETAEYYIVTFNTDGGTSVAETIKIVKGEPLGHKYPITWKDTFNFDGWFSGATEYTEITVIPSDITLTAKWTKKTLWNVTFDSGENNHFPGDMPDTVGTYGLGNRTFIIQVYDGDGIFNRLPTETPLNHLSPSDEPEYYYLVYWLDRENRLFVENAFIPIVANITLSPKWGAPDYIVPLREDPEDPVKTPAPSLVDQQDKDNPNGSNPQFRITQDKDGNNVYTIWNEREVYSNNRWQLMYWIRLNLPSTFNIEYYSKYSVNANFYGNEKATATYRKEHWPDNDTLLPSQFYIQNAGDQMIPNRHGYGQISFTIDARGTGESSNEYTIFQQYNLGMGQDGDGGSINSTWKPVTGNPNPSRPQVLLIQTSDDWIGHIEVTEIRFHNDPDPVAED